MSAASADWETGRLWGWGDSRHHATFYGVADGRPNHPPPVPHLRDPMSMSQVRRIDQPPVQIVLDSPPRCYRDHQAVRTRAKLEEIPRVQSPGGRLRPQATYRSSGPVRTPLLCRLLTGQLHPVGLTAGTAWGDGMGRAGHTQARTSNHAFRMVFAGVGSAWEAFERNRPPPQSAWSSKTSGDGSWPLVVKNAECRRCTGQGRGHNLAGGPYTRAGTASRY